MDEEKVAEIVKDTAHGLEFDETMYEHMCFELRRMADDGKEHHARIRRMFTAYLDGLDQALETGIWITPENELPVDPKWVAETLLSLARKMFRALEQTNRAADRDARFKLQQMDTWAAAMRGLVAAKNALARKQERQPGELTPEEPPVIN